MRTDYSEKSIPKFSFKLQKNSSLYRLYVNGKPEKYYWLGHIEDAHSGTEFNDNNITPHMPFKGTRQELKLMLIIKYCEKNNIPKLW